MVVYCSTVCQKQHWQTHKPDCLVWRKKQPLEHTLTNVYPFTDVSYVVFVDALSLLAKERGGIVNIWTPKRLEIQFQGPMEDLIGFTFLKTTTVGDVVISEKEKEHLTQVYQVAFFLETGIQITYLNKQQPEIAKGIIEISRRSIGKQLSEDWYQGKSILGLNVKKSNLEAGFFDISSTSTGWKEPIVLQRSKD